MIVTLGAYLKEIAAGELRKPAELRRAVPTYEELAARLGIDKATLWRFASGSNPRLNLTLGHRIMAELRGMGFEMQIADLVTWEVVDG